MQQLHLSHWNALHRDPELYAEYRRQVTSLMAEGIRREEAEKAVFDKLKQQGRVSV